MWQSEHPLTDNSSAIKFKKSPLGKRGEWIYTDFNGRKNNRLLFKIIKCLVEKLLFTFCSNVSFLYTRLLIYIHWSILHKVEKPLSRGEGKQEIRLHYVVYRTLNPFELMRHTWDLIFANSYIKLHLPIINCFINMLNYYKTRL